MRVIVGACAVLSVFSSVLLSYTPAYAIQCRNPFAGLNEQNVTILDARVPLSAAGRIAQRIMEINDWCRGILSLPPQPEIQLRDVTVSPGVIDSHIIQMGMRILMHQGLETLPGHELTVLTHEYGHILLDFNLSKRDPHLWQSYLDAKTSSASLIAKRDLAENTWKKYRDQNGVHANEQKLKQLELDYLRIKKESSQAASKLAVFNTVIKPYGELFADLVAVAHMRDGRACAKALETSPLDPQYSDLIRLKDFTVHHPIENWDYESAYGLLSPTRSFLWSEYLSQTNFDPALRRAELLSIAVDAIGSEIKFRLAHPDIELGPPEINERLIQSIRARVNSTFP